MEKKAGKCKLPKSVIISKARKICTLYVEGDTIASCCEAVGVKYNTFLQWAQPNLTKEDIKKGNYRRGFVHDVHYLYKGALTENNINYKMLLKHASRAAILKRINGYSFIQTNQEVQYDNNGKKKGITLIKTEKAVAPDVSLLIFVAKSRGDVFQ